MKKNINLKFAIINYIPPDLFSIIFPCVWKMFLFFFNFFVFLVGFVFWFYFS